MRAFAPKPAATLQPTHARSATHFRPLLSQTLAANAGRHDSRQPVDFHAQSPAVDGAGRAFGHDFSRVPASTTSAGASSEELTVNAYDDAYEREADRVSLDVMRAPESRLGRAAVQTKRVGAAASGETTAPPAALDVLRSAGRPLDSQIRESMESRFGHDFGRVRVHTDASAADASRAVGARAFTTGRDIVFDAGEYAPTTVEGRRLIAHELTHVVQQQGAGPRRVIQRSPPQSGARARTPRPQSVGSQLAALQAGQQQLTQRQGVLEKRQAATELDLRWRAQFGERLASYRQAISRISGALDAAAQGFQAAQVAQAQTDALVTQLIGMGAAMTFAFGFEWAFAGTLGRLGVSAGRVERAVELFENPANAAVSGSVNVAGVLVGVQSTREGQMPSLHGGAIGFLTRNTEMLDGHVQRIEMAFANRSRSMQGYSDEQWLRFNPQSQETVYQTLFNEMNATATGVEGLKAAEPLALVMERKLWALWISNKRRQELDEARASDELANATGSGSLDAYGFAERNPRFDLGADIEVRLNEVGVARAAGVTLTGSWYSSNSSGWRQALVNWAQSYNESMRA